MDLKTSSELTLKSPLENQTFLKSKSDAIEIIDSSSIHRLLHLRGSSSGTILRQVFNTGHLSPEEVFVVDNRILVCLAEEEFVIIQLDENEVQNTTEKIQHASNRHLTITDLTHGRGQIKICGSHAQALLSKLCGLDFSEKSFPNKRASQTSFTKVHTLIVRLDEDQSTPTYYLIMDRSLAVYVWEAVIDASGEDIVG
jgi:heterotetrameric sarcosine oxidase gamma subunit